MGLTVFGSAVLATGTVRAETIGIDPYYTGSLISPSPASSKAGLLAIEPYVFDTLNPATYDLNGNVASKANKLSALQTLTLIKYGITDDLSVQIIPTTSENFDQQGFDSGSQIGDTSAELEYLLTRQDKRTGKPSISASVGLDFPTGRYENLDGPSDGYGNGTYRVRLGLLGQSLLFGESEHPVRIRVYGTGAIPLDSVGVHGFSTFGTSAGFNGTASSGINATAGASIEYSFTQKVVFAFDIYQTFSTSNSVTGSDAGGPLINLRGGSSRQTQIAPALEYNFNDSFGIIAGVALSVAGVNTSTLIQPQIAFNFVFDTNKPLGGMADILAISP